MPRLNWTEQSLTDVQRLYRFLAPKNIGAAIRAVKAIRGGVQILTHQPRIGRLVNGMPSEFREWLISFGNSGYVVRYRWDETHDEVVILAIRHQRELGFHQ